MAPCREARLTRSLVNRDCSMTLSSWSGSRRCGRWLGRGAYHGHAGEVRLGGAAGACRRHADQVLTRGVGAVLRGDRLNAIDGDADAGALAAQHHVVQRQAGQHGRGGGTSEENRSYPVSCLIETPDGNDPRWRYCDLVPAEAITPAGEENAIGISRGDKMYLHVDCAVRPELAHARQRDPGEAVRL